MCLFLTVQEGAIDKKMREMREEQEDKEAAEKLKNFKEKKTSNHKEGDHSYRLAKETGTEKLKTLRERMKRESALVI